MSSFNSVQEKESITDNKEENVDNFPFFNKQNLKKAIAYLKDLNFNEVEIDEIYEKAKNLIKNKQLEQLSEKLTEENAKGEDLEGLLNEATDTLETKDLMNLMKSIAKEEDFLNFMQDLLLEKLL